MKRLKLLSQEVPGNLSSFSRIQSAVTLFLRIVETGARTGDYCSGVRERPRDSIQRSLFLAGEFLGLFSKLEQGQE